MFVRVLSFGYSSWFSITESKKAKETQKLREVKHIDIEDTKETSETCQNNPGNTGSLMLNFLISHVLQLVLLIDIQVFVKKRVGSTPTCQLSVRFWSKNMHFYRKNFTFSFNFQLTVSFLFIIQKLWMKTNLFFCISYTIHRWKENKKNSCSRYYSWRVGHSKHKNCILHKIEVYCWPQDRVVWFLEKTGKSEKSFRKKISNVQSQAKLREKKAKILQQLQKEHLNAASTLKKLEVTPGQVGRPPLESRMMGLHQAILRNSSS